MVKVTVNTPGTNRISVSGQNTQVVKQIGVESGTALKALETANLALSVAQGASNAAPAFNQANTARDLANTKVSKSGDLMSGVLYFGSDSPGFAFGIGPVQSDSIDLFTNELPGSVKLNWNNTNYVKVDAGGAYFQLGNSGDGIASYSNGNIGGDRTTISHQGKTWSFNGNNGSSLSFPDGTIQLTAYTGFGRDNLALSTAQSAFFAANNAVTDFSPAFNQANLAFGLAQTAFGQANAAPGIANSYATVVGNSANTYATSVGTAGNTFASSVGVSANAFATSVGTAGNTYTNLVGTAANNFAGTMANSANARANTVGASSNAWANTIVTAANNFAGTMANSANARANSVGASANAWANTIVTAANNFAGTMANSANARANSVGASSNAYANTITAAAFDRANIANSVAIYAANFANTINITAGTAYDTANAGFQTAQSAFTTANNALVTASAAYNNANTKLSTNGGTITGDLSITGNLNVSGNTNFISVTNFRVDDPLIYLAANNYVSDIVDIGFIANYVNATGANVHTGLYREHEDKMYYLFQGYDREPANNHIGALSNNMTLAVLNADVRTSNLNLFGANAQQFIINAFTQANAAPGIANSYAAVVGTSANVYAASVGVGANAYATSVGASGNAYAITVGVSSNAYATSVGAAGNTYANSVGVGANAYATSVGASGNSYATLVGESANARANAVGTSANSYSNLVGTSGNAYALSIATSVGTSGNAYADSIVLPAFNQANTALTTAQAAFANSNASVKYNASGTFTERQVFTSNLVANTAAFSITPRAANPTNVSDGDIWFNSSTSRVNFRLSGGTREFMQLDASQTVTGKKTFVGTSTLSAINIQPVAGNPTSTSNGDIWYNSTNDKLSLRTNNRNLIFATNTDVEFATGRSANTEVMFNDNGQANGSGLLTFNKGTGTLTVGNLNVLGITTLNINSITVGSAEINNIIVLTSTTSDQILDQFSNTYRSVVYTVTMNVGTDYQVSQINLLHNDNDAFMTEYGIIAVPNTLAIFSSSYASGSVRLNVTPTFANTTYKIVKTSMVR